MEAHDLEVTGVANGGFGIARTGEGVIFVEGALPGERVRARIIRKSRKRTLAVCTDVLRFSSERISPPCVHFEQCGGCQWQYLHVSGQIRLKETILLDCLGRIASVRPVLQPFLQGDPYGYRYRCRVKVSKEGDVGFFSRRSHRVVPVSECIILNGPLNRLLARLSEYPPSRLRGIDEILIAAGEGMAVAAVSSDVNNAWEMRNTLGLSVLKTGRESLGGKFLELDLAGMRYSVPPDGFFQANWALNQELVERACSLLPEGIPVVDFFAGAGNFSLRLAQRGHRVTAVEAHRESVASGRRNARRNGLPGVRFMRKDAAEAAKQIGLEGKGVLFDPPRTGLPGELVRQVNVQRPAVLVYVSCDPATFSRDVALLSDRYAIDSIRVVDLFPQTSHVETLARMVLRG